MNVVRVKTVTALCLRAVPVVTLGLWLFARPITAQPVRHADSVRPAIERVVHFRGTSDGIARAEAAVPLQPPTVEPGALIPRAYLPVLDQYSIARPPLTKRPLAPFGGCRLDLYAHRFEGAGPNDVAVDGRGTIWFGTPNGAYGLLPDGTWEHLTRARGLANDDVTTIAVDGEGYPWFGTVLRYTYPGGDRYWAGGLSGYRYPEILTWRNTQAAGPGTFGVPIDLAVTADQSKWLAMGFVLFNRQIYDHALYRLKSDRSWERHDEAAGVNLTRPDGLFVDADDNLWVVAQGQVVVRRSDGTWTDSVGPGAPAPSSLDAATVDPTDGQVWYAGYEGDASTLSRGRLGGPWLQMPQHSSMNELGPHTLGADAAGNLWWASEIGAGVRWADGTFEVFPDADLLGAQYIRFIRQDSSGAVWLRIDDGVVRVECRARSSHRTKLAIATTGGPMEPALRH